MHTQSAMKDGVLVLSKSCCLLHHVLEVVFWNYAIARKASWL